LYEESQVVAGKLLKPEWRRISGQAAVPFLQPMNREFQARFTAILLGLLTVAAVVLSLDQVMLRPLSVLPLASLSVAVSGVVLPTDTLAEAGETATEATGTSITVMVEVPLRLSHIAVMRAEPAATPFAMPLVLTVAAAVLSLDQVTGSPPSVLPPPSLAVAISCWPAPTGRLADAGETDTVATESGVTVPVTVMTETPVIPALLAVMVAVPGPTALTTPDLLTVATLVLSLDQLVGWPLTMLPEPSMAMAVSGTVPPTATEAAGGLTVTEPMALAREGPVMPVNDRHEVIPPSISSEAARHEICTTFR